MRVMDEGMSKMWSFLKKVFGVNKQEQTTYIYCKCGNEMCSDGSFISDTIDRDGQNHVQYKCGKCGLKADYNFDIAPVPINWDVIKAPNPPDGKDK